jgi:DNA polymerase III alpha subunit
MKCDKYSNPLFQESDIFDLIYQEVDIDTVCSNIYVDDLDEFQKNSNIKFLAKQNQFISIEEFDKVNQSQWFIPDDYQNIDIEEYLVQICPKDNYERLIEELQEYRKRDMLNLLKWLKFLVDTMRQNQIIWGVGRGSSVASYVLYLLGIHKIDSVKYKLDFKEFMR